VRLGPKIFHFKKAINLISEGGVFGQDNHALLQSLINANPGKKIVIPSGGTIYISKPLVLVSNTKLIVNGTLKLTPGVVRPLTQPLDKIEFMLITQTVHILLVKSYVLVLQTILQAEVGVLLEN
jgi:hypothetical protein